MATYLETLTALQRQSIDALKQAQATQLALLTTLGEAAATVPAFRAEAVADALPTLAEFAELNATFARSVLEQQTAYASQLAGVFTATQKNAVGAAERVVASAAKAAPGVK